MALAFSSARYSANALFFYQALEQGPCEVLFGADGPMLRESMSVL